MTAITVKRSRLIRIPAIIDGFDGTISVVENRALIPFAIKRVYYIYNLIHHENVVRGKHAHKTLEQVLFCINGSCRVLLNDGMREQEIELSDPSLGIYLGPLLWHTMYDFRNNCILLVLASDFFKEEEYIRDFGAFKAFVESKQHEMTARGIPQ